MPMSYLHSLRWCINAGLDAEQTRVILALQQGDETVSTAWRECTWDHVDFIGAVQALCGIWAAPCDDCGTWHASDDLVNNNVCRNCYEDNYVTCERCSCVAHDDYASTIGNGETYCDRCRDRYCIYCEGCEEYFDNNDNHSHEQELCKCEAPLLRFAFPANGEGTIGNDEELELTLPAGVVSDEGVDAIIQLLYRDIRDIEAIGLRGIRAAMEAVGNVWQGKRGNLTRRLSRELYANHGKVKLPEHTLSEVGNLARQHSSATSQWSIEFTRDLNQDRDEFCHSDSCWWTDYASSRCALKNWGGMGLRTFGDAYGFRRPNGRAWVQPLNEHLLPTHDAIGARAYLVYNGYGELSGYTPARIVGHLTDKTYRKITFNCSPQYINDTKAWLVADEATCQATDTIRLCYEPHDTFDANYLTREEEVA